MMVVLLVAGIGLLLAGLAAIGFGIQINEFGLGNTLIIAGTVAACTGMLLLGLWMAVKELKTIARRLGPVCGDASARKARNRLRQAPRCSHPAARMPRACGPVPELAPPSGRLSPPWHGEAAAARSRAGR